MSIMRYYRYLLLLVGVLVYQIWKIRSTNLYPISPHSPGVGISLTAEYAVLSVRRADGGFEDVGKVLGSEEYVGLMRRCSESAPRWFRDVPRGDWVMRMFRKAIGFPASTDVAILAHMLEKILFYPHTTPGRDRPIVISYPALQGLSERDILDAAAYLGINVLTGYHVDQPRTMIASYAGHGLGLCETYEDYETCTDEALKMPVRDVLVVEYTEHALMLHADTVWEAQTAGGFDVYSYSDFGLESRDTNGRYGVERIREAVARFMRERYVGEDFIGQSDRMLVIMTGDGVRQEVTDMVVEQVREVCSEVEVLDQGHEYVAARGAAELAWRAVEWPVQDDEL